MELQAALAQLVASELVFQRGTPPAAVYTFKHALVQDAAHDSLLRNARRQLHAQIAEAFETHSPDIAEGQPELLAQHYAEAGLDAPAIEWWRKAGDQALRRSAFKEAAAPLGGQLNWPTGPLGRRRAPHWGATGCTYRPISAMR